MSFFAREGLAGRYFNAVGIFGKKRRASIGVARNWAAFQTTALAAGLRSG